MSIRIVYLSISGAGKCTSMTSVLRALNAPEPTDPLEAVASEYAAALPREAGACPSVLSMSARRAHRHFENLADAMGDELTRRELQQLAEADGFTCVVDSQRVLEPHDRQCLERFRREMLALRVDVGSRPLVIQANKRDLPGILSRSEVEALVGMQWSDYVESVAEADIGTLEAVNALVDAVLVKRSQGSPPR